MFIQGTPLLVEKADVAPNMTIRFNPCKQERLQLREPLWLKTMEMVTLNPKKSGNQWPHKIDLGQTKRLKKEFYLLTHNAQYKNKSIENRNGDVYVQSGARYLGRTTRGSLRVLFSMFNLLCVSVSVFH